MYVFNGKEEKKRIVRVEARKVKKLSRNGSRKRESQKCPLFSCNVCERLGLILPIAYCEYVYTAILYFCVFVLAFNSYEF